MNPYAKLRDDYFKAKEGGVNAENPPKKSDAAPLVTESMGSMKDLRESYYGWPDNPARMTTKELFVAGKIDAKECAARLQREHEYNCMKAKISMCWPLKDE